MLLDFKKSVILVISSILLYYTLISPNILPRVTVCSLDAFCITIFEILTILTIRYLSMLEAKALETEILVQYTLMNEIINNTSLAMYIKKPNGTILLANNKLSELLKIKLAEMVDMNFNYIGQIERGEANVTIKTMVAIADALDVELKTLFDFTF